MPGFGRTADGHERTFQVNHLAPFLLTNLRHIALISPEKGTRTLLWLARGTPGTTWTPGLFYTGNKTKIPNPQATDDTLAAGLWTRSAELAGLPATP